MLLEKEIIRQKGNVLYGMISESRLMDAMTWLISQSWITLTTKTFPYPGELITNWVLAHHGKFWAIGVSVKVKQRSSATG